MGAVEIIVVGAILCTFFICITSIKIKMINADNQQADNASDAIAERLEVITFSDDLTDEQKFDLCKLAIENEKVEVD